MREGQINTTKVNENEGAGNLEHWFSKCLHVDGPVGQAVELLEHVVAVRETILAEGHPVLPVPEAALEY